MTKKTWLILGAMALILITVGYFHYKPAATPPVQVVEQPAPAPIEQAVVSLPAPAPVAQVTNDNHIKVRIKHLKFAAAAVVPAARPSDVSQ